MWKKIKNFSFMLPSIFMTSLPILSFYQKNQSELSFKFFYPLFPISITLSTLNTLTLFLLLKNKSKTGIISFMIVFVFFSYGHLSNFLNDKIFIPLPNSIIIGPDKILFPLILWLFILITFKVLKSPRSFEKSVSFINFSLLLVIFYLIIIITKTEILAHRNKQGYIQFSDITKTNLNQTPDIYYIVLDGYAREDILKNIYKYDNSKFIKKLKEMGFYVADNSRSNYIHTYLSLASTLNMRYLDDLPAKYGKKAKNISGAKQLIWNNLVVEKLRKSGYKIINFASTWDGTNENFPADITYKSDNYFQIFGKNIALEETNIVFLQTTIISPFIKKVWGDALRTQVIFTLQKLPTTPFQKGKKFVFAHIIAPHPPYVFNAKGDPVPNSELEFADEGIDKREKYLNQLIFISNQIIPVLENIIKNSENSPIIILQSDHGPASIFGKRDDWLKNYSEEGAKERSSILYAIYFPDKDYKNLYSSITPVNTFRIIFNKYFNENLKILPDKTFYNSYEEIYGFKDITNILILNNR